MSVFGVPTPDGTGCQITLEHRVQQTVAVDMYGIPAPDWLLWQITFSVDCNSLGLWQWVYDTEFALDFNRRGSVCIIWNSF